MLLKKFLRNPKTVGSVFSSSRFLARKMTESLRPGMRVLELGAGTGVITKEIIERGISPEDLHVFEIDPDLCAHAQKRFPSYHFVCDDIRNCMKYLEPGSIDVIVSGLPFRNFGAALIEEIFQSLMYAVKPDGYMIQFTYGLKDPLDMLELPSQRKAWVLFNMPPAFVWQYHFASEDELDFLQPRR